MLWYTLFFNAMIDFDIVMRIYSHDKSLRVSDLYSPDVDIQNAYFNFAAESENYHILDAFLFQLAYMREPFKVFASTVELLIDRAGYDTLLYLARIQQRQKNWVQFIISDLFLDHLLENFGRQSPELQEFLLAVYQCRDMSDHIHTKFESWNTEMVVTNRYGTELMDYETYNYNQWCLGHKQPAVDSLILDHWDDFFQHCVKIDDYSTGTRVMTLTFLNMVQDNRIDLVIQYVRGHTFRPFSTCYMLYSYGLFLSKQWLYEIKHDAVLDLPIEHQKSIILWCYLYEQWHDSWCHIPELSDSTVVNRHVQSTYKKMTQILSRVYAMNRLRQWVTKATDIGGQLDRYFYAPPDGLMLRRSLRECFGTQ